MAIDYLRFNHGSHVFNLGSGSGTTIFEVMQATQRTIGRLPTYNVGPVRLGDPAILVADTHRANVELRWQPMYTLDDIVEHAWAWYNGPVHAISKLYR